MAVLQVHMAVAWMDNETEADELLSSIRACIPACCSSKLPALPTMGKPNVWLSGLLSTPSLLSTSDMSPRCTVPVVGGDPSHDTHLRMSLMLDCDVPPMPWIRLCTWA